VLSPRISVHQPPPSSSGLGHLLFTEATGIRLPLGVQDLWSGPLVRLGHACVQFLKIYKGASMRNSFNSLVKALTSNQINLIFVGIYVFIMTATLRPISASKSSVPVKTIVTAAPAKPAKTSIAHSGAIFEAVIGFTGTVAAGVQDYTNLSPKFTLTNEQNYSPTSYFDLIQKRVDFFSKKFEQKRAETNEIRAISKFKQLRKNTMLLKFVTQQLEWWCFQDPAFAIVSPRALDLKKGANKLHQNLGKKAKEYFALDATDFNWVLQTQSSVSPEKIVVELEEIAQQAQQLVKDYLIARFEISMIKICGMGTSDHRIMRPVVPLFSEDGVENFNVSEIEKPIQYSLPINELIELIQLFDNEVQRVLLGYHTGDYPKGAQFRRNPFYIDSGDFGGMGLGLIELESSIQFRPENNRQFENFIKRARAYFLANPQFSNPQSIEYSLRPASSPRRPERARPQGALPYTPANTGAPTSLRIVETPRILLSWSLSGTDHETRLEAPLLALPSASDAELEAAGGARGGSPAHRPSPEKRTRSGWESSSPEPEAEAPKVAKKRKFGR